MEICLPARALLDGIGPIAKLDSTQASLQTHACTTEGIPNGLQSTTSPFVETVEKANAPGEHGPRTAAAAERRGSQIDAASRTTQASARRATSAILGREGQES
jgi:hypothetical protein